MLWPLCGRMVKVMASGRRVVKVVASVWSSGKGRGRMVKVDVSVWSSGKGRCLSTTIITL